MLHSSADPAEPVTVEFAEYVRERRAALLRIARAIATDPDLAEDLLQTVLVKVGSHWSAIRNHGAADAYVRRAMVNQQASWYREKWRKLEVVTSQPPEPTPDASPAGTGHDWGDLQLWPLARRCTSAPPALGGRPALLRGPVRGRDRSRSWLLGRHREVQHQPRRGRPAPPGRGDRVRRPGRLTPHQPRGIR
jgi:hypothetical protein